MLNAPAVNAAGGPAGGSARAWLREAFRRSPVTMVFVVACCAVYAICLLQSRSVSDTIGAPNFLLTGEGLQWFGPRNLGWEMVFYQPFVTDDYVPTAIDGVGPGQWWRIWTAALVHLSAAHLAMNTIFLLLVGCPLERMFGSQTMVATIIAAAAGGSWACAVFQPENPAGGASTVAYALSALLVVYALRQREPITGPLVLVLVNIGFSVFLPGVSLWGHLGGLAAGVGIAVVLLLIPRQTPAQTVSFVLAGLVSAGAVLAM